MTTVLVAVDDTDASVRALRVANELFGPDAHYAAITVAPDPDVPSADINKAVVAPFGVPTIRYTPALAVELRSALESDDGGRSVEASRERATATAAEQATAAHVADVEPVGRIGDPVHAIIAAAAAHHADVIVVGSHEHGWLRRTFGHSVPDQIIREASCPVLIVK